MTLPSIWRVLGKGAGRAIGGVYDRRILGLYIDSESSSYGWLSSGFALTIGIDLVGRGVPVALSIEVTSPVWKNVGRVCCRTYIARPMRGWK
jgi:hypothetical protein